MTEESRKKHKEHLKRYCGTCIHKEVCSYKNTFDSVVFRAIHEVQADDYLVDVFVQCKYHADKYGTTEKEVIPNE